MKLNFVLGVLVGLSIAIVAVSAGGWYQDKSEKEFNIPPNCPGDLLPGQLLGVVGVNGTWYPIYSCVESVPQDQVVYVFDNATVTEKPMVQE